jgi:hypothetical protein
MRIHRTITASLVAVLGAGALAGPAAAGSAHQADSWYAGKSTIQGSTHSPQRGPHDSAKANVYVPPDETVTNTVAGGADSAKANVYVPPNEAVTNTVAGGADSAKANVYVPPRQAVTNSVARGDDSAASARSWGVDWGSVGIGAAAGIGAFLIALGGAAALRRRRQIQPSAVG